MKSRIYTPGAERQPPVLAGRDDRLRDWSLMLSDAAPARSAAPSPTRRSRGAPPKTPSWSGPERSAKPRRSPHATSVPAPRGALVVDLQAVRGEAGLMKSLMLHARRLTAAESGPCSQGPLTHVERFLGLADGSGS